MVMEPPEFNVIVGAEGDGYLARYMPRAADASPNSGFIYPGLAGRCLRAFTEDDPFVDTYLKSLRPQLRHLTRNDTVTMIGAFPTVVADGPVQPIDETDRQTTVIIAVAPDSTTKDRAKDLVSQCCHLLFRYADCSHGRRSSLAKSLSSLGLLTQVAVEVIEGEPALLGGGDEFWAPRGIGIPFGHTYWKQPAMAGCSIGASTCKESGTLGFFLKLELPDQAPAYLAVTCHHTVDGMSLPISLVMADAK